MPFLQRRWENKVYDFSDIYAITLRRKSLFLGAAQSIPEKGEGTIVNDRKEYRATRRIYSDITKISKFISCCLLGRQIVEQPAAVAG